MGFSFSDPTPREVDVDVPKMLEAMRTRIEVFAQWEDLAQHVVDTAKDPPEAWPTDHDRLRAMSVELWQNRNWWFDLSEIVPFLNLELMKHAPKNLATLEKFQKFWAKPFRLNTVGDTVNRSKKYLSVLAELRKQLGALQTAAVHARASESKPEVIGKFELYDALGDEPTKNAVASVLRKATRAMTTLGLGAYCYGNVTIVNSSKIHSHSSAFYAKNTDEIYVGNMKGQDVRAVCHEIGHRIHTKLNLRNKTRSLYETVKDRGTWVSDYAKTDDEENFCEMLSFAAVKDLPDEGKDLLKTVIPKIKLATAAGVVARLTQTLTVADRCADRVARRHLLATAADVRDHLREEHQMLDASRLLKPRTLRVIEPAAVFYYRRNRAWEIRVRDEATAEKVVTKAQADLIPKSKLEASDPYLHQLELYVSYPGGFVQASGLAEKKRDTAKFDAKRQIMLRGQEVFGKAGIRLTGGEGAYVLRLLPVRKELRGKFRPAEVTAPTLEKLSELLDTAISKVQSLL